MGQDIDEEHEPKFEQVSGCYKISQGDSPPPPTLIEHCCLMTRGNKWNIEVKCRPQKLSHVKGATHQRDSWRSLKEAYPDAKIQHKHNDIEVTLPSLQEDIEIAAFGRPGKEDHKRMQMAIFGGQPSQGRNWKIRVYLVDDTTTAYKQVCQKEEERGHKLLQPLAGMFVSNSNEDIKIELSSLESGWKIKGSTVKTIKLEDAWNSPENSRDFPNCHFEISHEDKRKQSFFCVITASHGKDTARAEIVEYFERERSQILIQPSKNLPKVSNQSQPHCSKETSGWLPTLLFLFSFLLPPNCQTSVQKGTINKYDDQHSTTRKAAPTETLKKLMFAVFQNHRLKETNKQNRRVQETSDYPF